MSDRLKLRLIWKGKSKKRPAADFACALISHLFDSKQISTVQLPNDIFIEGLNLEECVGVLKAQNEAELSFNPEFLRERKSSIWRLRVEIKETDNDGTQKVKITFPSNGDGSGAISQLPVALWWMEADPDYPTPFNTIALPHNNSNIHAWALHGLVGLANQFGNLDVAELYLAETKQDQSLVARWYPQKPTEITNKSISPVVSVSNESLWLPVPEEDHGEIKEIQLWYENKSEPEQHDTLWQNIRNQLAVVVQSAPNDISAFQAVLNKFKPHFGNIEIKEIQSVEHVQFMVTPQEGTIFMVVPEKDRIVFGVNFEKASLNISEIILHGLGHVALGHVQPNDEYGHSDTIDSVLGIGSLKRWDTDVKAFIPAPKPKTIEDCTPHEKACLGLHRMIGEMLGESRRLHPKAEQYQNVIYQRQAAQRLLAMIEEYSGAMLCDGVGLGKTYVTTTLIVHYANMWRDIHKDVDNVFRTDPFRITVLAPNSVVSTWQREALPRLAAFGVPLSSVRVISHTKLSKMTRSSAVLERSSVQKLSDLEHLLLSDFVVVDEAHNFRSVLARRTVVLRDLLRLQPRKETNRRVVLLTATPVNNSLDDLQQEVSLLYSRPIPLSDAVTSDGYRRQAVNKILKRCNRARSQRGSKGDVAPLIIHGDSAARFPVANDFRDDLNFGPNVQRIGDYLKEQDKKLKRYQDEIRDASRLGVQSDSERAPIRIADELLDRIVVQRSRTLCKEIEYQQGSDVELLFRPDAGMPEKLYYSDEYDGIQDVLSRFLPLFNTVQDTEDRRLSLKVYMWYDVKEGFKTPVEVSPVVGLQRILVLKRLESSPVAFLITLLRLTVLHAFRVKELLDLCKDVKNDARSKALQSDVQRLVKAQKLEDLDKILSLATGETIKDIRAGFIRHLGKTYGNFKSVADCDDQPIQLSLFDEDFEETSSKKDQLNRLWDLKDTLIKDLETLLAVTPGLADIVFGRFSRDEWPRRFTAGGQAVDWPSSPSWGLRIITDAKLRQLVARLLKARREKQKVIVFSQFSDPLAYVYSVLRVCASFSRQDWATVITGLSGLGLPGLKADEVRDLLSGTEVITGDTEDRDAVVNAFSPYYRIGPKAPATEGANRLEAESVLADWQAAWHRAITRPIHVLFSTDVLAEGVNLQDAAALINFDVHWNPVRMIQRAGRIDRRLNPAIEKETFFPELESLAKKNGKSLPRYYWHESPNKAPLTINMILPDTLESELMLRERIATKTLAIDFTLGLEQGTGAEAQWMENYKYQGISSLNSFQKDRAIERIASHHQRLSKMFLERGVRIEWAENLNTWIRAINANQGSPLIGRALLGRRGGELERFNRYLEPAVVKGIPYWFWAEKQPGESMFDGWLILDGRPENFPPHPQRDIPWHDNVSMPLRASHLLGAAECLASNVSLTELSARDIGRPLMQGGSALAAPKLGSDDDRRLIALRDFFILQIPTFEPGQIPEHRSDRQGNNYDGASYVE